MTSGFEDEKGKPLSNKASEQSNSQVEQADRRVTRLKIGPGGRVVIPAAFRKAMQIEEGDSVTAILDDGELRLVGLKVAVRNVQAWVRQYVPEGVSLVDELIEDRRREAEEEERGG